MAGSIRKRPDRGQDAWELRIFLGRDQRDRIRHKSQLFRGSRRAAEKELSRLVLAQDFEPELVPEPETRSWDSSSTVNDAIEGWKRNGWDDLSPVTARRYENVWNVHIKKTIGRERIARLTPYEVERYFRELKAGGAGRDHPLCPLGLEPGLPARPQVERQPAAEPRRRHRSAEVGDRAFPPAGPLPRGGGGPSTPRGRLGSGSPLRHLPAGHRRHGDQKGRGSGAPVVGRRLEGRHLDHRRVRDRVQGQRRRSSLQRPGRASARSPSTWAPSRTWNPSGPCSNAWPPTQACHCRRVASSSRPIREARSLPIPTPSAAPSPRPGSPPSCPQTSTCTPSATFRPPRSMPSYPNVRNKPASAGRPFTWHGTTPTRSRPRTVVRQTTLAACSILPCEFGVVACTVSSRIRRFQPLGPVPSTDQSMSRDLECRGTTQLKSRGSCQRFRHRPRFCFLSGPHRSQTVVAPPSVRTSTPRSDEPGRGPSLRGRPDTASSVRSPRRRGLLKAEQLTTARSHRSLCRYVPPPFPSRAEPRARRPAISGQGCRSQRRHCPHRANRTAPT